MPRPQLTFFTELGSEALVELFDDPEVIEFLARGSHRLSMAMMDLSPERAEVIRRVEAAGIDMVAWVLLDESEGYWLNADNAAAAMDRYAAIHAFSRREGLTLPWLGLDVEPPRSQVTQLLRDGEAARKESFRQRRSREQIESAERAYAQIVTLAHRDGRKVESYQYPHIVDERRWGTHLLRRSFGLVDIDVDLEFLMLYRSYFGLEACRSYYEDAQAIAIGVTGGGVHADDDEIEPKIGWDELRDDLLAAARHTSHVGIFSLEGCVWRGMLEAIEAIDWSDAPAPLDLGALRKAKRERGILGMFSKGEPLWDVVLPSQSSRPPPRD